MPFSTRTVSLKFSPRSCFENFGVQPSRFLPLKSEIHSCFAGSFFAGCGAPRSGATAHVSTAASIAVLTIRGSFLHPSASSTCGHVEHHPHPGLDVFGDVTMQHPLARIRHLHQHVNHESGRHENRI